MTKVWPIVLLVFILAGCGAFTAIQGYSAIEIKPDTNQIYVTTPAPSSLSGYDESIASLWERTYNYCIQIKFSLAKEVDQREIRLASRKAWLLGLGGLAGLANTTYSGINDNPRKEVVVPLGLISGAALLTFLPSIAGDERLDTLKQKQKNLTALLLQAREALIKVDLALTQVGFLDNELDELSSQESPPADEMESVKARLQDASKHAEDLIGILKQSIAEWSVECE